MPFECDPVLFISLLLSLYLCSVITFTVGAFMGFYMFCYPQSIAVPMCIGIIQLEYSNLGSIACCLYMQYNIFTDKYESALYFCLNQQGFYSESMAQYSASCSSCTTTTHTTHTVNLNKTPDRWSESKLTSQIQFWTAQNGKWIQHLPPSSTLNQTNRLFCLSCLDDHAKNKCKAWQIFRFVF